jgi:tetratricopeptide (TPR) repeat protein
MIQGQKVESAYDLETQALIASGLREKKRISEYRDKLSAISGRFMTAKSMSFPVVARARCLFHGLWQDNPKRYQQKGNYRLNQVIDAQLMGRATGIGNCLGLTLLYNCLLRLIGIEPEVVYLEDSLGLRPHVLTLLRIDHTGIEIENMFPDGFDYGGYVNESSRTIWGHKELVADIYHSVGTELFEKGALSEALINYDKALELNPQYERARLNKIILADRMKLDE